MYKYHRLILTLSFILQISLGVGLTGLFALKRNEKNIERVATNLHEELTHQIEKRLIRFLEVPRITNQLALNAVKLNDFDLQEERSLERHLVKLIDTLKSTSIDTIQYGNEKGDYLGAGRLNNGELVIKARVKGDFYTYSVNKSNQRDRLLQTQPNYDPRLRPWYQKAKENRETVWSPIFVMFSHRNLGVTLSDPIYNDKGQLIGIVGSDILLNDINKFLKDLKIGETGRTFIVQSNGEIVASSENLELLFDDEQKKYIKQKLKRIDETLAEKLESNKIPSDRAVIIEVNGNKRFIQVAPLKDDRGLDLLLITDFSDREFEKLYRQNLIWTIKLCLLALILSYIVALASNQVLVKRGLRLIELRKDSLTGLPNRAALLQRLRRTIKKHKKFTILFINCNRLTIINNSIGHSVGDKLLIAVAKRLKKIVNASDLVARIQGDKFCLVSLNTKNSASAIDFATKIKQEFSRAFIIDNLHIFLKNSIKFGIVIRDEEHTDPEHLLRDSYAAMLKAKNSTGMFYQVFDTAIGQKSLELFELEYELYNAFKRGEFVVYYQPIVSLNTDRIIGLEALVRWQHPQKGLISPGSFIPVAEDNGLIVDLGLWVLKKACQQFSQWQYPMTLSVNLSPKQIYQPNLLEKIDEILKDTGINPHSLKFELTESALVEDSELAREVLEEIKARNIRLSLDDFGTGYSCLSYLQKLSIDTIKIDRSFLNGEGLKIVKTIVTLAHNLGMDVVAEGIETQEQKLQIKELGCEYTQGYLFSRPLDSRGIEELLSQQGYSRAVKIKVIGVGKGGCNAVNRIIESGIVGVEFWAIDTDTELLSTSIAPNRLQIGKKLTNGLSAKGEPAIGQKAAEESREEIAKALENTDLVFIIAGMGGGTGTGAAPIVAEIAREMGYLTIGIVTRPFTHEGSRRTRQAEEGISALESRVDTAIVIANNQLLSIISPETPVKEAFTIADDILRQGVQAISDIVTIPSLVNVDFADVRSVMADSGSAIIGIGMGNGKSKAVDAAAAAINSPLVEYSLEGATGVIFNVTGGTDLTLREVNAVAETIYEQVDPNANIIFGATIDEQIEGEVKITIIATGFTIQA